MMGKGPIVRTPGIKTAGAGREQCPPPWAVTDSSDLDSNSNASSSDDGVSRVPGTALSVHVE